MIIINPANIGFIYVTNLLLAFGWLDLASKLQSALAVFISRKKKLNDVRFPIIDLAGIIDDHRLPRARMFIYVASNKMSV